MGHNVQENKFPPLPMLEINPRTLYMECMRFHRTTPQPTKYFNFYPENMRRGRVSSWYRQPGTVHGWQLESKAESRVSSGHVTASACAVLKPPAVLCTT